MAKQVVTFVIDKELDIKNHLIGLDSYKNKKNKKNFSKQTLRKSEELLNLSEAKRKNKIEKDIEPIYKKGTQLRTLARDINTEWARVEKKFIKKLEKVHQHPFPYKSVKGVLSTASRFGYNTQEGWFATSVFENKYSSIDIATHELMHFMFHKYFWKKCRDEGLSENKIWDIKEAFTVLLNLEFGEFRFKKDFGYLPHQKLRKVIEKAWISKKDFNFVLDRAIKYYR